MNLLRLKNTRPSNFFRDTNLPYQKIFWLFAFLFLFLIVPLLLWMSASSVAQESTTFSGRLIDTEGNPISGITIYIRHNKGPNHGGSRGPDDSLQTRTDAKGRFAFPNIVYDSLKLEINGTSKIGYEINVSSVEFGEIALYPDRGWHWSSVKFDLELGVKMENVIITAAVRTRPKIRTRVVYADGTPLANTEIYVYRRTNRFARRPGGSSRGVEQTDDEGYAEEGRWQWHSGEPVNYTRWETYEPEGGNSDAKDYVMTGHFGWGWEAAPETYETIRNSQDPRPHIERAILEKGTVPFKTLPDPN